MAEDTAELPILGGRFLADHAEIERRDSAARVAGLYRAAQPAILRYLTALVPADAEDVAAQTWLEVSKHADRVPRDDDGARAWVFTIARRRAANARRWHGRHPSAATDVATLDHLASRHDPEAAAVHRLSSEEACATIVRLLPPHQAEVVLLRVVADLDVDEVASIVGRRTGAVRMLQSRGLRKLAELLPDP